MLHSLHTDVVPEWHAIMKQYRKPRVLELYLYVQCIHEWNDHKPLVLLKSCRLELLLFFARRPLLGLDKWTVRGQVLLLDASLNIVRRIPRNPLPMFHDLPNNIVVFVRTDCKSSLCVLLDIFCQECRYVCVYDFVARLHHRHFWIGFSTVVMYRKWYRL